MTVRVVLNPGFEATLSRTPAMKAMLRDRGERVANEAERIGRGVAGSYRATVEDSLEGVQVEASTAGINAASWIEFGTGAPTPTQAYAPLRRGSEAAGLKTTGARR